MLRRNVSFVVWQLLKYEYGKTINAKNINHVSFWKIYQTFKNEEKRLKEIYLHNIISSWIENKKFLSEDEKLSSIKKLIRKTNIKLNKKEQEEMLLLEERAFSIERNIKRIDVNLRIKKKEHIGAKYVKVDLFNLVKNKKFKLLHFSKELLISNKRFIYNEKISFSFNQIEWFSFDKQGFSFKYKDNKVYVFRLYDNESLNNTISNILKKNKNILSKEKPSFK